MRGVMTTSTAATGEEKPKRASRTKRIETVSSVPSSSGAVPSIKPLIEVSASLSDLISKTEVAKKEILDLQEKILETQKFWSEEQKEHGKAVSDRNSEEELVRKREKEEYDYQTKLAHRKAEDEFNEKRSAWERELQQRKDELAAEKKELAGLRVKVSSFDTETQKAVKEAQNALAKELEERYDSERRLREQEVKSEKEILNLRIASLTAENSRQATEIETLKKALEEATRQVKDIAVKVIEGRTPKVVGTSEI